MHLSDPTFPPVFTSHSVKAPERAVVSACRRAQSGEVGAGDIVWARGTAMVECAFVLEPEIAADRCREMAIVLQTALVDALGSLMPSQTAIQIGWPSTVVCNGARIGETVLIRSATEQDGVPDWLVLGARIVLRRDLEGLEPGQVRNETSLAEEDGADIDRTALLETLASHVLATIHDWTEDGLRPVAERWIGRVLGYGDAGVLEDAAGKPITARVMGLGDDLALMIREPEGGVRHLPVPQLTWPCALPPGFGS